MNNFLMNTDVILGFVAVSSMAVLICYLLPPPPDDYSGPGCNAP